MGSPPITMLHMQQRRFPYFPRAERTLSVIHSLSSKCVTSTTRTSPPFRAQLNLHLQPVLKLWQHALWVACNLNTTLPFSDTKKLQYFSGLLQLNAVCRFSWDSTTVGYDKVLRWLPCHAG